MEDKIEVGEYARSTKGIIGILKEQYTFENGVNYPEPQEWVLDVNGNEYIANETNYEDIVKHSKNIIDLIEVGDYVNGEKVTGIDLAYFNGNDRLKEPKRIGVVVGNDSMFKFSYHIKNEDIKDIVTHEQFESMKYERWKE